jgi:hypothetical protein
MRFMMIVKANKDSEAGKMPSEELLNAMVKYNEELLKAGVLLDLAGLHPSSRGARIQFTDGKRTVIDGPFAETKELIAGYWLIQVKSKQEAVDWATLSSARFSNSATSPPARQSIAPARSARNSPNARKPHPEDDHEPSETSKITRTFPRRPAH